MRIDQQMQRTNVVVAASRCTRTRKLARSFRTLASASHPGVENCTRFARVGPVGITSAGAIAASR